MGNHSPVIYKKISFTCIVVTIMATMLFSCSNDIEKVKELTTMDSIPDITVKKIKVKQSEGGLITLEMTAPKLQSYQGKDPYTEFPEGIRIVFFDSLMKPKSELTAKYGISWDNKKIMEAKGDVVVKNYAKQAQLNTEHLTWDENKRKMFSEQFVKISTPEKVITGKSMESDEVFDNWVVRNVSGTFYVKEQR
jgi:LPS export ABC transporter protein LptC